MHDFDFLFGTWDVANRRLSELFTGSTAWDEFPGHAVIRPVLDGMGNIDEIHFPTKDFRGVTLRLYDPSSEQWKLHWADTTTGALLPPVTGGFTDGRGDFHGDDTHEGRPVRVHFVWSDITEDSARWTQRFSADEGASWETNWTMDLTRTGR
ncbi:hypothetical protein [Streptomyces sp. NPDC002205]|uniref:hypothetical protein n=1 Tax=Streptomyces sp. NPDC002205 TaxID=3154411 RepID=UPI00331E659B